MRRPIRNHKLEIIGWVDEWSDRRTYLFDRHGKRLGAFEGDTGTTRKDAAGEIIGYESNQLFRLLSRS